MQLYNLLINTDHVFLLLLIGISSVIDDMQCTDANINA